MAISIFTRNASAINATGTEVLDGHDTFLKEGSPNTAQSLATVMEATKYAAADHSHMLLEFQQLVATIGTNAVNSATLYIFKTAGTNHQLRARKVLGDINIQEATWNERSSGNAWGVPGALGAADTDQSGTFTSLSTGYNGDWVAIPATAVVQDAIANQTSAKFWVERADAGEDQTFSVFRAANEISDQGDVNYMELVVDHETSGGAGGGGGPTGSPSIVTEGATTLLRGDSINFTGLSFPAGMQLSDSRGAGNIALIVVENGVDRFLPLSNGQTLNSESPRFDATFAANTQIGYGVKSVILHVDGTDYTGINLTLNPAAGQEAVTLTAVDGRDVVDYDINGDAPVVGDIYEVDDFTAEDNIDVLPTANGSSNLASEPTRPQTYRARVIQQDGTIGVWATKTRTLDNAQADTTRPVITLTGPANITLSVGDTYTEQGATATDDTDGDITANIQIGGSVDTANAGTYTRTYDVSDAAGNNAIQVTRTVTVQAVGVPSLQVLGFDDIRVRSPSVSLDIAMADNMNTKILAERDCSVAFTNNQVSLQGGAALGSINLRRGETVTLYKSPGAAASLHFDNRYIVREVDLQGNILGTFGEIVIARDLGGDQTLSAIRAIPSAGDAFDA